MDAPTKPAALRPLVSGFVWTASFIVAAFYIISAFGWFGASYMALSGQLGEDSKLFIRNLSAVGHILRLSQVVLIVVASVFLLLRKRSAQAMFLTTLGLACLSVFVGKWGISFLGRDLSSLALLTVASAFVCWLAKRGVLR